MKTICLYFEIHQNIQLKRYRFFDIGTDHYYYDDYENARIISDVAERSYMPALTALLDMIKQNGNILKWLSRFQAWVWNNLRCMHLKLLKCYRS